jgi:hypothetical protein
MFATLQDGLFTSVTSSQSSLVLAEPPQGMIAGTVMHAGTTLKLVVPESVRLPRNELVIDWLRNGYELGLIW